PPTASRRSCASLGASPPLTKDKVGCSIWVVNPANHGASVDRCELRWRDDRDQLLSKGGERPRGGDRGRALAGPHAGDRVVVGVHAHPPAQLPVAHDVELDVPLAAHRLADRLVLDPPKLGPISLPFPVQDPECSGSWKAAVAGRRRAGGRGDPAT